MSRWRTLPSPRAVSYTHLDCIDLFKKADAALQTDPRYLELDAARRENDMDEELQNMIGEFNLARLDLNNESAKAETCLLYTSLCGPCLWRGRH